MQINSINNSINFQRRLLPNEEADFSAVLSEAKLKAGNSGHSILIMPSASLPQEINTGVGNLLDKKGQEFIDFAKQYWGINYVQLLPEGRYKYLNSGQCLPYSGSSLDLGEQLINLESLTTQEYGNLLSKEELLQSIKNNPATEIKYENVLPKNSPNENKLKKAYNELLKADTQEKKELLREIQNYSEQNKSWLEPKGIFEALSSKYNSRNIYDWNEFDKNFYNTDIVSLSQRESAIRGIKNSELGQEIGFYEFKQYLAENHLAKAKDALHKKGIKLSGDVLIGFSNDEVWANPKAFIKNSSIGWGIPALDLESEEGINLLRKKFNLYAKRYDGLRIDASWTYASQPLNNILSGTKSKKEYGAKILDIIEDEIRKVKGLGYNSEDIMHEFIAKLEDFDIYENGHVKDFVDKRNKIYCTNGMHSNWGSVDNFRQRGWRDGSYVLGTTNHDCKPMKTEFLNPKAREEQTKVLSEILHIPKEKLATLSDFIKAKFAEPMRSKHNMIFFSDALNLDGQYKDNAMKTADYRMKIPSNYDKDYFISLQKGEGFNVMDALEKAFVSKGLDKTEPDLYKKVVKYRQILQAPEGQSGRLSGTKLYVLIGLGIGIVLGLAGIIFSPKKKPTESVSNG